MNEHTYQIHETERGTHILVFNDGVFETKIFVDLSEYNPDSVASVLDRNWATLFKGTHERVMVWLMSNDIHNAKMVAVGKDMQILSLGEYRLKHA